MVLTVSFLTEIVADSPTFSMKTGVSVLFERVRPAKLRVTSASGSAVLSVETLIWPFAQEPLRAYSPALVTVT